MLDFLGTLNRNARPVCVGLTWPNVFDRDPVAWRRSLSKLRDRLRRAHPEAGIVYALDMERRRTGISAGVYAPHVHALLYLPRLASGSDVQTLRAMLGDAWTACVGGDEEHRRAGVYVEVARHPRAARLYLVAHKKRPTPDEAAAILDAYPDGVGTCWGIWNRTALPTVEPVEVEVTEAEADELRASVEASASAPRRRAR